MKNEYKHIQAHDLDPKYTFFKENHDLFLNKINIELFSKSKFDFALPQNPNLFGRSLFFTIKSNLMSQKINSVGKLDLGPRLELFDKCVKSLEDEIAELETGKLDGTLDLVGSYAIKDEFRALLPFINGPLLTFQEAMLQTKCTSDNNHNWCYYLILV